MRLAMIGQGNGRSIFGSSARDMWGAQPRMGSFSLGQTAQDFYNRAKAAVTGFDQQVQRIALISSSDARASILSNYGISNPVPNQGNECGYAAAVTRNNIADADQHGADVGFPDHGPSRNRVEKLEGCVTSLQNDVDSALRLYGALSTPAPLPAAAAAKPLPGAAAAPAGAAAGGISTAGWIGIGAGALVLGFLALR
jgi:hypothetical protein